MPESSRITRRGATRRDLPALCLIFASIGAFAAIALPTIGKLEVPTKVSLTSVSGHVVHVSRGQKNKHLILVQSTDKAHHLTQTDFGDASAIESLREGDNIDARVLPDSLGRDLEWYWEVKKNGVVLVSYDDTLQYTEGANAQSRKAAMLGGACALGLIGLGFAFRLHFVAWRDQAK